MMRICKLALALLCLTCGNASAQDLGKGLIAYWSADNTLVDIHNSLALTDSGSLAYGTGHVYPQAWDLEKNEADYLSIADNPNLETQTHTFAIWFRPETITGGENYILFAKTNATAGSRSYELRIDFQGRLSWRCSADGTNEVSVVTTETVTANAWHLATCTVGGGTITVQLDDGQVYSANHTGIADTTSPLTIGTRAAGAILYDGLIGPFSLWNRLLSPNERAEIWNGGVGVKYETFHNEIERIQVKLLDFSGTVSLVIRKVDTSFTEPPVFDGLPTISGTLQQDATLTAVYSFLSSQGSDAETFVWLFANDANGTGATPGEPNPDAPDGTYVPDSAKVGKWVAVQVTASSTGGQTVATSAYVGPITSAVNPPTFVTPAFVSGSLTQGSMLTVSYDVQNSAGETWQWYTATNASGAGEAAISGATGTTYVTQSGDIGDWINNKVTATNGTGSTTSTATYVGPIVAGGSLSETPLGYTTFVSRFQARVTQMGTWWDNPDPDQLGPGKMGEREPWLGYFGAADHFSNPTYDGYAQTACDVMSVTTAFATGNTTGYFNITDGFAEDWIRHGDTSSRASIKALADNASYAKQATVAGSITDQAASRECAYTIQAYANAEAYAGDAHNPKILDLMDIAFGDVGITVVGTVDQATLPLGGHIEQWLANYVTDESGNYVSGQHNFNVGVSGGPPDGFAPFMAAYTINAGARFNHLASNLGTHDGADDQATLTDSDAFWITNEWVGRTIQNTTTGSSATVISNTPTTITATLSGGSGGENDWDTGDNYRIVGFINGGAVNADPRVLEKSIRIMDAAWNVMWVPAAESMKLRFDYPPGAGAPDVNTVIFPAYAWLYLKAGNRSNGDRHRIRADLLFQGSRLSFGAIPPPPNPLTGNKQWNDYIRHTFKGLKYYKDGVNTHGN
jgi:hypothetical protein